MKQTKLTLLFIFLVWANSYTQSYAQSVTIFPEHKSSEQAAITPPMKWFNQAWVGNNLPYQEIRQSIDIALAKKQITVAVLDAYQAESERSRTPALSFFKWAYACCFAARQSPPILQTLQPGAGRFDDLSNPQVYDYTRLQFLYSVPGRNGELIPLARKLIKKDSHDYLVIYSLVGMFGVNPKSETKG